MNDTEKLESILLWGRFNWMRHDAILRECQIRYDHGITVHSRAADLRKKRPVECKVMFTNGRRVSWYRLVPA